MATNLTGVSSSHFKWAFVCVFHTEISKHILTLISVNIYSRQEHLEIIVLVHVAPVWYIIHRPMINTRFDRGHETLFKTEAEALSAELSALGYQRWALSAGLSQRWALNAGLSQCWDASAEFSHRWAHSNDLSQR